MASNVSPFLPQSAMNIYNSSLIEIVCFLSFIKDIGITSYITFIMLLSFAPSLPFMGTSVS
jgi:hypothetical protein